MLSPINPATGLPREEYPDFVDTVRERVLDGRGLLVIFDYDLLMDIPEERIWISQITDGLPVLNEYPEGIIFGNK